MLIYLDANIVQYCADHGDFVFGATDQCQVSEPRLKTELEALRHIVELEQLGDWDFATSPLLLKELTVGRPTVEQSRTYAILEQSFSRQDWPGEQQIKAIRHQVVPTDLQGQADGQHIATALAMGASWFLTNDRAIISRTAGHVSTMRVARPSDCPAEIAVGLFLK
jgi:hypothetical protein